jgi:hypothetical protein
LGNFLFDDCVSITGKYVLKQNPINKKSFILEVEIVNNLINNFKCLGFNDLDGGFNFFNIESEIAKISKPLNEINSIKKL